MMRWQGKVAAARASGPGNDAAACPLCGFVADAAIAEIGVAEGIVEAAGGPAALLVALGADVGVAAVGDNRPAGAGAPARIPTAPGCCGRSCNSDRR